MSAAVMWLSWIPFLMLAPGAGVVTSPAVPAAADTLVSPGPAPSDTTGAPGLFDLPATAVDLNRYNGVPVGRLYCTGNARTQDRVILQEMLLEPGGPFDAALAEESLRNLRALAYVTSARLLPHYGEGENRVDLEIQVEDSFPWFGAVVPSLAGGRSELTFLAGNGNFRGAGQTAILFLFLSNEVRDSFTGYFLEPRLFGSRWGGELSLGYQGDVGPRNRVSVFRRLYALATPWGFGFAAYDEAEERLLYDGGYQVSDYYGRRRGGSWQVVRGLPGATRRVELGARYGFEDAVYRQAPGWDGVIPGDKTRATLTLEPSVETVRFERDSFFNAMGPVEDLRLGLKLNLIAGGALQILGSDRNYPVLGAGFRWFQGRAGTGYLLAEANLNTRRVDGAFVNTRLVSTVGAFARLPGDGLLAWRGQLSWIEAMEDPQQLLLDSPNGLRGYAANLRNGQRRYLTNFEWRQPWWRPGSMVLGTALFADAGIIGSPDRPLRTQPVLVGAGAGLRVGFSGLLGAPVIRLDVAYGFKVDGWETSFGFGQRF